MLFLVNLQAESNYKYPTINAHLDSIIIIFLL